MAKNLFGLVHTLLDNDGTLEVGGTIEVYQAGTSTQLTLYSDRALTTTAGYIITADASGRFPERWIPDGSSIKLVYKNASGSTLATRDYANDNDDTVEDNGKVTPEAYGADGTVTNDTAAWLILGGLGKTIECKPAQTYKIKSGITITADHFKIRGNGCTFEIQDGTGGFDTKDITVQFNTASSNTCLFYGVSREGLEFHDFTVTQASNNERVIQIIGVQGGHASYPLRISKIHMRGLRSGRAYMSINSIGVAGYHIDDISSKLCTISGTDWTGSTPDVGLLVIDSDLLASAKSARGFINNVDCEDGSFLALAPSQTFTASSSSGLLLTVTSDIPTGTALRFTTTTTLPTGLSLATTYYAIRVSATTIRVATSYANAIALTAIAYTNAGTGTHTLTTASYALYGDQSDALTLAAAGNTHGPVIDGVRGKNVFEVIDCFATKAVISNVEGEDCGTVLKFVHGASYCTATNISGKGVSNAVVSIGGSYVAGAYDATGNVISNVTGSSFGSAGYGILFQNNTGTTGIPKKTRISNAIFVAGAGTAPVALVKSNIPATFANTFTASSSSGLLLTATNDFDTGQAVVFTTTTTLPTGLSLATTYYLIRISATTTKVATSYDNAIAGTAIAYTDAGTGTHTMTVTNACNNVVDGVGGQYTSLFCDVVSELTCKVRASNPTHVQLSLGANQTLTSLATVDFSVATYDPDGMAVTASDKVRIKFPGVYLVRIALRFSTDLDDGNGIEIRCVGGGDTQVYKYTAGAGAKQDIVTGVFQVRIKEQDVSTSTADIYAQASLDGAGDCTILTTANYTGMWITRVG